MYRGTIQHSQMCLKPLKEEWHRVTISGQRSLKKGGILLALEIHPSDGTSQPDEFKATAIPISQSI